VLAARLDRLPPEEKHLVQVAAVIGTEVPVPLLQWMVGLSEEALQQGLLHLQSLEFLYETPLFPEHAYTFKHALTQEVAYAGLLQERRCTLHARIVAAIERLYADRLPEQVERLAHHAFRGQVWDKAVVYCRQAGTKAYDRTAFREAVIYFNQALAVLAHVPESLTRAALAIDLHLDLAMPRQQLGEYEQLLVDMGAAEVLARALDDRARLGRVLVYKTHLLRSKADHPGAIATPSRPWRWRLNSATGLCRWLQPIAWRNCVCYRRLWPGSRAAAAERGGDRGGRA